jgi:hypothetical protein
MSSMQKMHSNEVNQLASVQNELFVCLNKLNDKVIRDINSLSSSKPSYFSEFELTIVKNIISQTSVLVNTLNEIITEASQSGEELFLNFQADQKYILSLFKAIQNSIISEDSTILIHLLEHDLQDTLKAWKIDLLPRTRKAIQAMP